MLAFFGWSPVQITYPSTHPKDECKWLPMWVPRLLFGCLHNLLGMNDANILMYMAPAAQQPDKLHSLLVAPSRVDFNFAANGKSHANDMAVDF
jgi:hypothetical protein